ncbi:hypothetical protein ACLOJK_039052 [Asimina triloba]
MLSCTKPKDLKRNDRFLQGSYTDEKHERGKPTHGGREKERVSPSHSFQTLWVIGSSLPRFAPSRCPAGIRRFGHPLLASLPPRRTARCRNPPSVSSHSDPALSTVGLAPFRLNGSVR